MKRAFVSVALFAAFACSDSSGPGVQGSVAFSYTGAGGGNFSAAGNAPPLTAPPPTATSWAGAYFDAGETFVVGSKPRSGGSVDMAVIRFEHVTTGSEPIDASCDIDGGVACTAMDFYLNFNGNGDTGDFFCKLTSGTVVLQDVSGGRAKGTFSGAGSCADGTTGAATAFSVSGGTFDVTVVATPG